MQIRVISFIAIFLFVFQGCGTVKRGTIPWEEKPPVSVSEPDSESPLPMMSTSRKAESSEESDVKNALDRAFNDWQGVPYVLGGSGYNGVDCSSFMQIVFEDYFGRILPRNTREQFGVGSKINKGNIRTGDLVFFKTGAKSFHVGVMVNEAEFMHASTSSGVMISSLQNNYWQQVYYTARRVL